MERAETQHPGRRSRRKSTKAIAVKAGSAEAIRRPAHSELSALFEEFAERSIEFSREVIERSGRQASMASGENARLNLQVARTVFGKWSVEVLTFLYSRPKSRFQEIKNALGVISARVLSLKLTRLEDLGLVHRAVLDTRPPAVQYSLTDEGRRLARLGEPVFLYLRLTEGLLGSVGP
jgi:DNA-binding HxlR family transcriptional regulator